MTSELYRGGVAGRVIEELQAGMGTFRTEAEHVIAVRCSGAKYLRDELSAEARAILAEYDDVYFKPHLREGELTKCYDHAERRRILSIFTRLGLNMESEDTNDE